MIPKTTIGNKIVHTLTFLTPYFVTVIPYPLACPFSPSSTQTMLCRNCCDLFFTVNCAIKRVVLFGALKVLWKDNVSTKYVADCRYSSSSVLQSKTVRATRERAPDQNLCCLPREDMARKSLTKDGTKLSRRGIF